MQPAQPRPWPWSSGNKGIMNTGFDVKHTYIQIIVPSLCGYVPSEQSPSSLNLFPQQ